MFRALFPFVVSLSLGMCSTYEENVIFSVFKSSVKVKLAFNDKLSDKGCSTTDKLAFISHGWLESINSDWAKHMIGNLTQIRGGCIIFIDYSYYGNNQNYFMFLAHFASISTILTKRLNDFESEGFNPDNWFMFGHRAGARLVIDAAANFGYQKVKEIDVCEPAGPGFDYRLTTKQPQKAAKNVQCIHTSVIAGTVERLCHQDWMMGNCGRQQPASNVFQYYFCQTTRLCESSYHISHGLCPHYYNSAFKNVFASNNAYKCGTLRPPTVQLTDYKMGYSESRKSPKIVGDFFAPTTALAPWNVVSGAIKSDDIVVDFMF